MANLAGGGGGSRSNIVNPEHADARDLGVNHPAAYTPPKRKREASKPTVVQASTMRPPSRRVPVKRRPSAAERLFAEVKRRAGELAKGLAKKADSLLGDPIEEVVGGFLRVGGQEPERRGLTQREILSGKQGSQKPYTPITSGRRSREMAEAIAEQERQSQKMEENRAAFELAARSEAWVLSARPDKWSEDALIGLEYSYATGKSIPQSEEDALRRYREAVDMLRWEAREQAENRRFEDLEERINAIQTGKVQYDLGRLRELERRRWEASRDLSNVPGVQRYLLRSWQWNLSGVLSKLDWLGRKLSQPLDTWYGVNTFNPGDREGYERVFSYASKWAAENPDMAGSFGHGIGDVMFPVDSFEVAVRAKFGERKTATAEYFGGDFKKTYDAELLLRKWANARMFSRADLDAIAAGTKTPDEAARMSFYDLGEQMLFDTLNVFDVFQAFGRLADVAEVFDVANKARTVGKVGDYARTVAARARLEAEAQSGAAHLVKKTLYRGADVVATQADNAQAYYEVAQAQGLAAARISAMYGKVVEARDAQRVWVSAHDVLPNSGRRLLGYFGKPLPPVASQAERVLQLADQERARLISEAGFRGNRDLRKARSAYRRAGLDSMTAEERAAVALYIMGEETARRDVHLPFKWAGKNNHFDDAWLAEALGFERAMAVRTWVSQYYRPLAYLWYRNARKDQYELLKRVKELVLKRYWTQEQAEAYLQPIAFYRKGSTRVGGQTIDTSEWVLRMDGWKPRRDGTGGRAAWNPRNYFPMYDVEDVRAPVIVDLQSASVQPFLRKREGNQPFASLLKRMETTDSFWALLEARDIGVARSRGSSVVQRAFLDVEAAVPGGYAAGVRPFFDKAVRERAGGLHRQPARIRKWAREVFDLDSGDPRQHEAINQVWAAILDPRLSDEQRRDAVDTFIDNFITPQRQAIGELEGRVQETLGAMIRAYGLVQVEPEEAARIAAEAGFGGLSEVSVPPVAPDVFERTLYHGTRSRDLESFIDDDGNLVLHASENFGGRQVGVSFTEGRDTALDYATRVPGTPERSQGGYIFEIDRDALDESRLFVESGEEIATRHDTRDVIVERGRFRVVQLEGSRFSYEDVLKRRENLGGIERRFAAMSDDELATEYWRRVDENERIEYGREHEDVGSHEIGRERYYEAPFEAELARRVHVGDGRALADAIYRASGSSPFASSLDTPESIYDELVEAAGSYHPDDLDALAARVEGRDVVPGSSVTVWYVPRSELGTMRLAGLRPGANAGLMARLGDNTDEAFEFYNRVVEEFAVRQLFDEGVDLSALAADEAEALVAAKADELASTDEFAAIPVALAPGDSVVDDVDWIPSHRLFYRDPADGQWYAMTKRLEALDPADIEAQGAEAATRLTEQARAGLEALSAPGVVEYDAREVVRALLAGRGMSLGEQAVDEVTRAGAFVERMEAAASVAEAYVKARRSAALSEFFSSMASLLRSEVGEMTGDMLVDSAILLAEHDMVALVDDYEAVTRAYDALLSHADALGASAADATARADEFTALEEQMRRVSAIASRRRTVLRAQRKYQKLIEGLSTSDEGKARLVEAFRALKEHGTADPVSWLALSPYDFERVFGTAGDARYLEGTAQGMSAVGGLVRDLRSADEYVQMMVSLYAPSILDADTSLFTVALRHFGDEIAAAVLARGDDVDTFNAVMKAAMGSDVYTWADVEAGMAARAGDFATYRADVPSALQARSAEKVVEYEESLALASAYEAALSDEFLKVFGDDVPDFFERHYHQAEAVEDLHQAEVSRAVAKMRFEAADETQRMLADAGAKLNAIAEGASELALTKPYKRFRGGFSRLREVFATAVRTYGTALQYYRLALLTSFGFPVGNFFDIVLKNTLMGVDLGTQLNAYRGWMKTLSKGSNYAQVYGSGPDLGMSALKAAQLGEAVDDVVVREMLNGGLLYDPIGRVAVPVSKPLRGALDMGDAYGTSRYWLMDAWNGMFEKFADNLEAFGRQAIMSDAWDRKFWDMVVMERPDLEDAVSRVRALPRDADRWSAAHAESSELAMFLSGNGRRIHDESFAYAMRKMYYTHIDYENFSPFQQHLKYLFMFPTYAIGNARFWGTLMAYRPQWAVRMERAFNDDDSMKVTVGDYTLDFRYLFSMQKFGVGTADSPFEMVGLDPISPVARLMGHLGLAETMSYRGGVPLFDLIGKTSALMPVARKGSFAGWDAPRFIDWAIAAVLDKAGLLSDDSMLANYDDAFYRDVLRRAAKRGRYGEALDYRGAEQEIATERAVAAWLFFIAKVVAKEDTSGKPDWLRGGSDPWMKMRADVGLASYEKGGLFQQRGMREVLYEVGERLRSEKELSDDSVAGYLSRERLKRRRPWMAATDEFNEEFGWVYHPSAPDSAQEDLARMRDSLKGVEVEGYFALMAKWERRLASGPQAGPKRRDLKDQMKREIDAYLRRHPSVRTVFGSADEREQAFTTYKEAGFDALVEQFFKTDDREERARLQRQSETLSRRFTARMVADGYKVLADEFPTLAQYFDASATPLERRVAKFYSMEFGSASEWYAAYQALPRDVKAVVDAWRAESGKAPYDHVFSGGGRSGGGGLARWAARYPNLAALFATKTTSFDQWWALYLALPEAEQAKLNEYRIRKGKRPFPVGSAAYRVDWSSWGGGGTGVWYGVPFSLLDQYFAIPKEDKRARKEFLEMHPELDAAFELYEEEKRAQARAERDALLAARPDMQAYVDWYSQEAPQHAPVSGPKQVGVSYSGDDGVVPERKK